MKLWLKLTLGAVGAVLAVALFQGYQDARQRQRMQDARAKLTDVDSLIIKAARAVKEAPRAQRATLPCGLVAAAAFRIAEARDLGLTWEEATALTSGEPDLAAPVRQSGADPITTYAGLARKLYAMPAPPDSHFLSEFLQCNASR